MKWIELNVGVGWHCRASIGSSDCVRDFQFSRCQRPFAYPEKRGKFGISVLTRYEYPLALWTGLNVGIA